MDRLGDSGFADVVCATATGERCPSQGAIISHYVWPLSAVTALKNHTLTVWLNVGKTDSVLKSDELLYSQDSTYEDLLAFKAKETGKKKKETAVET